MQSFVNFEEMDLAEEIAKWDMQMDFNEGNLLDDLATPSLPRSPFFESFAPEIQHRQEQEQQEGEGENGQSSTTVNDQIAIANDNVAATSLNTSANGEVISASNSATQLTAASLCLLTLDDFGEVEAASVANPTHHQPSYAALEDSNFQPIFQPILNGTQMQYSNYSSPLVGLASQRLAVVSSAQAQEVPLTTDYLNLSSRARNELLNILRGRGTQTENTINSVPNVVANAEYYTFNGSNYQTSSYPSFYQQNPGDAGSGLGVKMPIPNQRNRFFSQQPQAIGPHGAWNSTWPQYNPLSTANAYDSQISPHYMQYEPSPYYRPQQVTGLMQQGSHVPGMPRTYDAPPYVMQQHAYPTHHARPEPYLYVQSTQGSMPPIHSIFGSMPPNGYSHQLGYGSIVPEPVYASGPPMCQYYPSQPQLNPFGTTYNSIPLRQPLSYDHHKSHYHSQTLMPDGFGQLGSRSFQLSGAHPLQASETRNEENRQRGQSSATQGTTTLARLTNSQVQEADETCGSIVLSSRGPEPEWVRQKMQDPIASPAVYSRTFEPLTSSRSQVALMVLPQIRTSSNRRPEDIAGIAQSASSSRSKAVEQLRQPENVQPISTSVPPRTNNLLPTQVLYSQNQRQTIIQKLEKELRKHQTDAAPRDTREEQQRPRRGRPPKRSENGGSPSSAKRPKQETVNSPLEAAMTSEYEVKEYENGNATTSIPTRGVPTTVYDQIFEGKNLPIDPHLRMLQFEKK